MNKLITHDTDLVTSEYAVKAQNVLWDEMGVTTWVVYQGPPPLVRYEDDRWTLERISEDDLKSTTPHEVWSRFEKLKQRGIDYECILIAHQKTPFEGFQIAENVLTAVKRTTVVLASILAALAVLVAGVMAVAAILPLVLVGIALYALVALGDPVVVVILKPSQEWLLLARWDQ